MIYRNRETGATVDVDSELSGVWEPLEAPAPAKPTKTGAKAPKAKAKKEKEEP